MIAVFLIIPYALAMFYLLKKSLAWTKACHNVCHSKPFRIGLIILTVFFVISPALGFLLPNSGIQHFCQRTSDFWLGVLLYTALVVVVEFIIKLILLLSHKVSREKMREPKVLARTGALMAIIIATVSIYGVLHVADTKMNTYDVTIELTILVNA